mmetsp:Transcript_117056/g.325470  ORF Transcript_117056/g.325470 Transcript_117056/m.325470 type:complete len:146 (-) Transcript_117056:136-573(-)
MGLLKRKSRSSGTKHGRGGAGAAGPSGTTATAAPPGVWKSRMEEGTNDAAAAAANSASADVAAAASAPHAALSTPAFTAQPYAAPSFAAPVAAPAMMPQQYFPGMPMAPFLPPPFYAQPPRHVGGPPVDAYLSALVSQAYAYGYK